MKAANVRLVPATPDQKDVVANLIQFYLHDITEFMPFPISPDGRFEYGYLERFWRFPYLVMVGDEIAGFALVVDECPLTGRAPCWFMAEFFVLKAYRGKGVGRAALEAAKAPHPGAWHIAVPHANCAAVNSGRKPYWTWAMVATFTSMARTGGYMSSILTLMARYVNEANPR